MPATKLAPGYKGATVMSFDENAPRALVAQIMAAYPQAGRDEIVRRVETALNSSRYASYLPAFIAYATINAYNAIRDGEKAAEAARRSTPARPDTPAAPTKTALEQENERHEREAERAVHRDRAAANVKRVLLNLVAPNGKLWRELSIAEYMTFGKKQFAHGKRMLRAGHKRVELLATATSEAELQKVFA